MKIIKTTEAFRRWRVSINEPLGLVPTMGALHLGHESLIQESKKMCSKTCVSIFVNPKQFGENEDFDKYPKTLTQDIKILNQHNVDVLFLPTEKEVYKKNHSFSISESSLSTSLEGSSRPQFFGGVMTIVMKLFNIVSPSHTFFGKKDFQQLLIVEKMILDFNLDIKLVRCETVRDSSGLAYSSRNKYLSTEGRLIASKVIKILKKSLLEGLQKKHIKQQINNIPNIQLDYLEFVNNRTLKPVNTNQSNMLICIAFFVEGVRVIDNF